MPARTVLQKSRGPDKRARRDSKSACPRASSVYLFVFCCSRYFCLSSIWFDIIIVVIKGLLLLTTHNSHFGPFSWLLVDCVTTSCHPSTEQALSMHGYGRRQFEGERNGATGTKSQAMLPFMSTNTFEKRRERKRTFARSLFPFSIPFYSIRVEPLALESRRALQTGSSSFLFCCLGCASPRVTEYCSLGQNKQWEKELLSFLYLNLLQSQKKGRLCLSLLH